MTGKDAQKDRRAVHFTIEMNRSTRNANLLAFPVALLALGVAIVVIRLLPLIPLWASVLPAAVAYAAVLFVTLARQRRGLRLRSEERRVGIEVSCEGRSNSDTS